VARSSFILLCVALAGCRAHPLPAPVDLPPHDAGPAAWRSALYPEAWSPDAKPDDAGRFLPDFSYAGYHRGEVAPPEGVAGPVFEVGAENTGATDATLDIQRALDAASDAGGGTVHLPAGLYRCDGLLHVNRGGIELRGDGSARSRIVFTRWQGMTGLTHLAFQGAPSLGPDLPLAVDGLERSTTVEVADAGALQPGDLVAVGWTITDAFVAEHGMTGVWVSFNGQWRPFFRREVVSVDRAATPNRVQLDIPLRYRAQVRDGASLRQETGRLREVGIRGIGLSNAVEWNSAWTNHRVHVLSLEGVTDGWVRDVTTFASPQATSQRGDAGADFDLQSGGLYLLDDARITVVDSSFARAQNRGGGGDGYLVELSRTSDALIRDVSATWGRHNLVQNWDFGTSGNVFLRCHSAEGRNFTDFLGSSDPGLFPAYSEFHHSLAMSNLIDSCVLDDGFLARNRGSESSGAGHTSTECVFWNNRGKGRLGSRQYGWGYVIGTQGLRVETEIGHPDPEGSAPEDWVEGVDAGSTLQPPSLYEDQLARRLGR
jgi:hypothetical protein